MVKETMLSGSAAARLEPGGLPCSLGDRRKAEERVARGVCQLTTASQHGTGFLAQFTLDTEGDSEVVRGLFTNQHVIGFDRYVHNGTVIEECGGSDTVVTLACEEAALDAHRLVIDEDTMRYVFSCRFLDATFLELSDAEARRLTDAGMNFLTINDSKENPVHPGEIHTIYQHPGGDKRLRTDSDKVDKIILPRIRYEINTAKGSSGSPIVNKAFKVVGVHHTGEKCHNYGTLIECIVRAIAIDRPLAIRDEAYPLRPELPATDALAMSIAELAKTTTLTDHYLKKMHVSAYKTDNDVSLFLCSWDSVRAHICWTHHVHFFTLVDVVRWTQLTPWLELTNGDRLVMFVRLCETLTEMFEKAFWDTKDVLFAFMQSRLYTLSDKETPPKLKLILEQVLPEIMASDGPKRLLAALNSLQSNSFNTALLADESATEFQLIDASIRILIDPLSADEIPSTSARTVPAQPPVTDEQASPQPLPTDTTEPHLPFVPPWQNKSMGTVPYISRKATDLFRYYKK